jgi:hypothetical protein
LAYEGLGKTILAKNRGASSVVPVDFMERVAPVVNETIRALAKTKFINDPVHQRSYCRRELFARHKYRQFSLQATREDTRNCVARELAGKQPSSRWQDDLFHVSRAADALVGSQSQEACRQSALPYGDAVRTIQVDMIAFDDADQTIRAHELNRGNGQFDAGKIRSIKRDLLCVQILLKSYGEVANWKPVAAESRIIFYYGIRSIPRPWSLVKGELDQHFGFPVVAGIEEAKEHFRVKLHELLERP